MSTYIKERVIIVPTVLYRAEAWGMRSVKRRKFNVLEMKRLKSLLAVSRIERVRYEEVRRRPGMEIELERRVAQRVLIEMVWSR